MLKSFADDSKLKEHLLLGKAKTGVPKGTPSKSPRTMQRLPDSAAGWALSDWEFRKGPG